MHLFFFIKEHKDRCDDLLQMKTWSIGNSSIYVNETTREYSDNLFGPWQTVTNVTATNFVANYNVSILKFGQTFFDDHMSTFFLIQIKKYLLFFQFRQALKVERKKLCCKKLLKRRRLTLPLKV